MLKRLFSLSPANGARRIESLLEIPQGTISKTVRIELTGNRRALVEGCAGILEYDEHIVRLNTAQGPVIFTGQQLCLSCLTEDNALLTGTLISLEFSQ